MVIEFFYETFDYCLYHYWQEGFGEFTCAIMDNY